MKPAIVQFTRLCILLLLFTRPLSAAAQPANDACGSAISITSGLACTSTAGTLRNAGGGATATAGINAFCGNAASPDVWYSFVAQSTFPTIRLSGMATQMDNAPRLQIFNTTSCVVATLNASSNNCASGTNVATLNLTPLTALTIGTTYLVRVFTNGNSVAAGVAADWNFNICVIDPAPANNLCGSSVLLTSSTACTNTTGTMYGATLTATTINAPNCASAATFDVWYRFVAQTTNPTITLSNLGSEFTNPGLQLLSNNCGATFTSYYCGTTSIAADFLTPGTTYFIRVYTTGASAPTTGVNGGFDICVQDPVSTAPFNDECVNAVNLPIWNSCNNIPGNMAGATASAIALGGTCTGPLAYDTWFKFTAVNATATLTLSSIGANFTNPRIEVLSGTCGSLTSIACGTSPVNAAGLTAGTVYYVRVYSTSPPAPNGNARFNICATTTNAPVRFGNTYVNVTKKTTGGVVETGDVLEIRMTISHTSGTKYNLRYVDNIPSNTVIAPGGSGDDSVWIRTNEGLIFKRYSLTAGDDAATYVASPPAGEYNIRLNMGFGGTNPGIPVNNTATEFASATGNMINTNRPSGGGGLLFAIAYRVVVTGNPGDTINLNPGQFLYKDASGSGPDIILTATPYKVVISDPLTLCTNSIGVNYASESGGTFGTGTTLNRTSDLAAPITGYTFISDVNAYNGVGDGRYALVKNLSPRSGTVTDGRRRNSCNVPAALDYSDMSNCNKRMFDGFWFIGGDHTGTNNAAGNAPPAATDNGGYMLMVNADYVASEVYRQTITNLCPNTYYEFSAWVKNICPTCGIDSVSQQFTGTPTAPTSGYPGVYPNLAFLLNDVDYYNTGEIDTVGWVKRGFVFQTGDTQTTATFSIRNNSQGGGGNDWALDDIAVATCLPNMSYSPTTNPMICEGNTLMIADTVRSFFNTYVEYKWQRSTDGGANWTDIAGTTGTATPVWNGTAYEFITTYTLPPAWTQAANSGDMYRVVVASTPGNLGSPTCSFTDPATIVISVLLDCGPPLNDDLLSVSGSLTGELAKISWVTSKETSPVKYRVDRSDDGYNFTPAGIVNGYNDIRSEKNYYSFDDPMPVNGKAYYRIAIMDDRAVRKISQTILLTTKETKEWSLVNIINPFVNTLMFQIATPESTLATIELMDANGRTIKSFKQPLNQGINAIAGINTLDMPPGLYLLRVTIKNRSVTQKVVKAGK